MGGDEWFKSRINAGHETDYNLKFTRIAAEGDSSAEANFKTLGSHIIHPWELATVREWEQKRQFYG